LLHERRWQQLLQGLLLRWLLLRLLRRLLCLLRQLLVWKLWLLLFMPSWCVQGGKSGRLLGNRFLVGDAGAGA